jgi:FMN-dependent oxidoreductase (nitrilotriacetate monooxygenase family)
MDDISDRQRRKISFNLLDMSTVSHNNYGLWAHPSNVKTGYNTIRFWTDFARLCERALFDTHFTADILGIASGYGGSRDIAVREGMHVPINDPLIPVSAMAAATSHIGFALTVSTSYEAPFALSRRMSTLDHLSKGRVGFNIVTSYLPNAGENFGIPPGMLSHDERYDLADEFMAVCYKLWEGSWDEDAVVRDRGQNIYVDPSRVRRIDHKGRFFSVVGPHLCEPSPQRTPVLFQAGASGRGKRFAGTHAEVVFVGGRSLASVRENVQEIRAEAQARGRRREDIRLLVGCTLIPGHTKAAAEAKRADFQAMTRADGYLAHMFGSGTDLRQYQPNELIADIVRRGGPGTDHLSRYPYQPGTTVADVMEASAHIGGNGLFACGTGEECADKVQEWAETMDVDGFLLRQLVSPGTVTDFIDYVMPALQRRGLYREAYETTTLRGNIFGHPRIADSHPAAAFRTLSAARAPAYAD